MSTVHVCVLWVTEGLVPRYSPEEKSRSQGGPLPLGVSAAPSWSPSLSPHAATPDTVSRLGNSSAPPAWDKEGEGTNQEGQTDMHTQDREGTERSKQNNLEIPYNNKRLYSQVLHMEHVCILHSKIMFLGQVSCF